MKRFYWAVFISLSIIFSASIAYGAGSISGVISYNGSQTGAIYVAAATSPLSCNGPNPSVYTYTEILSLGSYTLSNLPDGTYYLVSVIEGIESKATDPWGIYNGCDQIEPIIITGGNSVSNINITLIDGTDENPNPFHSEIKYYYFNVTGSASGYLMFATDGNEIFEKGFSYGSYDTDGYTYDGIEILAGNPPIKYVSPQVGQSWSKSIDGGDLPDFDVTSTVTSITDTVSVTAGTFQNCAKVLDTFNYPGQTPEPYFITIERWFCPGLGPAKTIITDSNGVHVGELTSYQNLPANASDYFPLGINYSWTFTTDDSDTTSWTITSETTYEAYLYSRHDSSGYWVTMQVDDPDHNISSVEVTGFQNVEGTTELTYDTNSGSWVSWIAPSSNPWFGTSLPATPIDGYKFLITDDMGPTYRWRSINSFVENFASDLSPANSELVLDNLQFSWTGLDGDYHYGIQLEDSSHNLIWEINFTKSTTVSYSGPELTEGETYYYNVLVNDSEGNFSVATENFVFDTNDTILMNSFMPGVILLLLDE